MVNTRRRFLTAAASAAALLSARPAQAAFGDLPLAGTSTIGVVVPLTGEAKSYGEQIADGVRGALDDANRSRGSLDRQYVMRTFDDQDSVATGVINAQFAIGDQSIVAVIGHLSGRVTDAALSQYANAVMPILVSATSYDPITAHGYRNVFRLPTKDSTEGILGAQYFEGRFKIKKPVVIAQDGYYGIAVAQAALQQFTADKLQPGQLVFPWEKPDYAAVAQRIMAMQPDCIYLAGTVKDMGPVVPLLRASGYTGSFCGSQGFFDAATPQRYGTQLEGMVVSSSMPPLELAPSTFYTRQSFSGRYGNFTPLNAFAYAATQIIVSASRRVGATNRQTLYQALTNPTQYQTVMGNFQFTFTGDPFNPNLYFYAVADGKWRYVGSSHPSDVLIR